MINRRCSDDSAIGQQERNRVIHSWHRRLSRQMRLVYAGWDDTKAAQRKSVSTAVNSMVNVTTTIVVVCKSCVLQTWPEASATRPSGPVRAESAKLSATAR